MSDLALIRATALRHTGPPPAAMPRLWVYALDHTTEVAALVYDPVVCLVLQGAKRTFIGDRVLEYGAGDCMIVAAEIAAMGQICEASPEAQFLSANLYLDPAVISSVLLDMAGRPEPAVQPGYGISKADPALLDTWRRMVELLDRPDEIPVMAHHLEHELMFRLLSGPQGTLLRQIARSDTRLSRIRQSMAWIRERYAEHLSIEAMAAVAGMSVSVFHRRFKLVTGVSPLQYHKQVRLHEARRRMVSNHVKAANVAYAVGYESASQFNREYKRLFGSPPRRDAEKLQRVDPGP